MPCQLATPLFIANMPISPEDEFASRMSPVHCPPIEYVKEDRLGELSNLTRHLFTTCQGDGALPIKLPLASWPFCICQPIALPVLLSYQRISLVPPPV